VSHAGTTLSSYSGIWGISVRMICRHRGGQASAGRSEAGRSGTLSDAELVRIVSDVWALHEAFAAEMMAAYRDELTRQALRRDRERSALVEALLAGPLADTATVWEAADLCRPG
jgi:hypothetical protein